MTLSDEGEIDDEAINAIFRAAHSIKGASGTFGFQVITDFTHHLETLLDEVRAHKRGLPPEDIDLYLQSVDYLRSMLEAYQSGSEPDAEQGKPLVERFLQLLDQPSEGSPVTDCTDQSQLEISGYEITLSGAEGIMCTGNDPYRLFAELNSLGTLEITADVSDVPTLHDIDPTQVYTSWQLKIDTNEPEERIREVFEWVIDDVELSIKPLSVSASTSSQTQDKKGVQPKSETSKSPAEKSTATTSKAEPVKRKATDTSIRVSTEKIDALINMVGELVITQSMLGELGESFEMSSLNRLQEGLVQLEQNTRELQESVMKIRMLPISFIFSRFPRMVRDLAKQLDKEISLNLIGESTELDKTVMEKLSDPMVHLVRNAVDHGVESTADRIAAGKPASATITLNAYHQGGNVVVEISDDGKGLDTEAISKKAIEKGLIENASGLSKEQIYDLLFMPGFSTAEQVSELSGRGVGMDVVKRNIQELNGSVEVKSEVGKGSTFSISLPLTLAILDGQLIRVGHNIYVIPLVNIIESIEIDPAMVNQVAGGRELYRLRDDYLPIIPLCDVFGIDSQPVGERRGLMVVVEAANNKVGLVIDDLQAQQQVVIKSLENNYKQVIGLSGATILGDGTVALIVDIPGIVKLSSEFEIHSYKAALQSAEQNISMTH